MLSGKTNLKIIPKWTRKLYKRDWGRREREAGEDFVKELE